MIEVHTPTYNATNEKAKKKLYRIIERHLVELKAAFDEYMNTDDQEKSPRRDLELEQYLHRENSERCSAQAAVIQAIHIAYPEPPKPAPVLTKRIGPPVVKSAKEAREKGYRTFVTIEEAPQVDVPEAWKDPNIQWTGHSVTEIEPTLRDQSNPARMTYEGEVYYRDNKE